MKRAWISICFLLLITYASPLQAVEYEEDIMPIFVKKCGDCHSMDGKAKGGLKLDDPEHFYQRFDKNSVIVPGDWDASYLFVTLFRPADSEDAMPPKGKGERLTPEETRLVQQWIADGAAIVGKKGATGPMPKEGEPGYIAVSSTGGNQTTTSRLNHPVRRTEENWTNREGRTIRATLLRVEGEVALLRMRNGQVYRVPIEKLSDESRARLK